jgi:DNA-binding CsgD family transcriptional regulator
MSEATAYERARERVVRICDSAEDLRLLRHDLLGAFGRVVRFEAFVWLLTDPETSVGSAPLAEVPVALLPELPRLIRLKYLSELNRWTTLDSSGSSLHHTSDGDLSQSLVWRELLNEHDVSDIASAVFRDRFGCWGLLDLWRASGPPFTEAETAFLASVTEPVTAALRRGQARTFVVSRPRDRRRVGPVVLLLSPDLDVLGQTPDTLEYLRALVPPADGQAPIPAGAYNVAAQLLAVEAGVDSNPPSARVHVSDGLWVTLRAARMAKATAAGEGNIAVTIEESSATERTSLFARAFGLSSRESELLGLLLTGTDTRELARRMFLSENTVQDHLKSIFAKTSTRSRGSLLALVLGT